MWFTYLDASGLARRYAPEVGTASINHLFGRFPADRLIVSTLGLARSFPSSCGSGTRAG